VVEVVREQATPFRPEPCSGHASTGEELIERPDHRASRCVDIHSKLCFGRERWVLSRSWSGEPMEIKDNLIAEGGWFRRPDSTVFNLYRLPALVPPPGGLLLWERKGPGKQRSGHRSSFSLVARPRRLASWLTVKDVPVRNICRHRALTTCEPAGARFLPTEVRNVAMPARREHAAAERQGMVIDAALALAAERGWDQVRFHLLAERTGMPMPEIGAAFRDVDAIANAWFARARLHLLGLPETALVDLSPDARIATACERWLDFLAPHRRVAAEILRGKLWPAHAHHWAPLVFNLSRLVHDLLDTARVPGEGTLRVFQEVGLTFMLLATLRDWVRDRSEAQAWTKRRLRHRLARAGRAAACLVCSRRIGSPQRPAGWRA
jgi:hypothetical protein